MKQDIQLDKIGENPKFLWHEIYLVSRDIVITFVPLFGGTLGLVELAGHFGYNPLWMTALGLLGVYWVIVHAFVIALLFAIARMLYRLANYQTELMAITPNKPDSSRKLIHEIVGIIEQTYREKQYMDVVRLGGSLSRPLMVSGLFATRSQIGEKVADAAARVQAFKEQIIALIDDIGWSNVLLGNVEKAQRSISHGVALAKSRGLFYYAAKGERHLAGIQQWYKNDFAVAENYYKSALAYAEKIQTDREKREMKAGILFGQANLLLLQNKLLEGLKVAQESKKIYEDLGGQEERVVKAFSQIGQFYLALGEIEKAEDEFHAGYGKSLQLGRRDELARNLLGLGQTFINQDNFPAAIEHLSEAGEIFKDLEMPREEREAKSLKLKAEVIAAQSTVK